ncbi:MAG: hypothetical protein NC452_02405 [Eubacterium sp.]|nr:hypothetical protein [Eubacterium sp.]
MDCPFYQSYRYCRKLHSDVPEDLFDTYCMSNYSYNDCPVYCNNIKASGDGCFLTSACIKSRGLPDDCYELRRLRWFRDNILAKTDDGKANIRQYYGIAPKIVDSINRSNNSYAEYENIYTTWILPCVSLIDSGEFQRAAETYTEMVQILSSKYLSYHETKNEV